MAPPPAAGVLERSVSDSGNGQSASPALERFYADLLWELDLFVRRPAATATGAAVVVKRVALAHGVRVAELLPLPRLTREEREQRAWAGRQPRTPE